MNRAVLAFVLGGCASLAPAYERPAAPVPASLPGGSGTQGAAGVPWHEFVREPHLQQVIEQALAQSRTLRRAALDIEVARAQYRIQRARALPSIDAALQVTSARQVFAPGVPPATGTLYSAQVGLASWELDVFGRLRSLSDARLQAYLSTVEAARAARISLIAETASAYLTLAADRSRLAIAQGTLEVAKRTMELTEQLVTGGASSRGDYWQAATVYQQARADIALLAAAIARIATRSSCSPAAPSPMRACPTRCPTRSTGSPTSRSAFRRRCCSIGPTCSRPSTT